MSTFWVVSLSAGSLVVTVIVTWYVSVHLVRPHLTAVLDFGSSVFRGVDDSIQSDLALTYRGEAVKDLYHLEFVIANRGHKAITDYVEPLTLTLEQDVEILDAIIAETSTDDLEVQLRFPDVESGEDEQIEFHFPLLNPRDWFRIKLLLEEEIDPENMRFSIRAADVATDVEFMEQWEGRPILAPLAIGMMVTATGGGAYSSIELLKRHFQVEEISAVVPYVSFPVLILGMTIGFAVGVGLAFLLERAGEAVRPTPPLRSYRRSRAE